MHRGYPNARARLLIERADLPDQLATLIDSTVSRTKLWSTERAEIAQELIAHTQDALDAGRSPEQIIETFGHPKRIAKLLTRSTKRKRPLYWRTLRNARRGFSVVFGLLFVVYIIQGVRYFSGEPNIATNYPAMINAHNDAYSEDQKAWPVYHDAELSWQRHILEPEAIQKAEIARINDTLEDSQEEWDHGLGKIHTLTPDHPQYEHTAQIVRAFEPHLALIREASHRPTIGIQLGFDINTVEIEPGVYDSTPTPPSDNPAMDGTMIELLLPHLGTMRKFSRILAFDTQLAGRESDAQRVYQNISAMLGLSTQRSFDQTVITDLVGIAIANSACFSITEIMQQHPGLLSRDHLIALSHELSTVRPTLSMSFEGEIMMFDDFIQRTYTDDGNGNGRLTKDGMILLTGFSNNSLWNGIEPETNPMHLIAGPIALTIAHDRLSETTRHARMMDTIKIVQQHGPRYLPLMSDQELELETQASTIEGLRYSPVDLLMPALGKATQRTFLAQMINDATTTMLALEIYKLDTGSFPATLSQLTSSYLPSIPMDLFDPGQPMKYTPTTEGGYLLYSVGSDGDDDGGTRTQESIRSFNTYDRRYYPRFTARFAPKYSSDGTLLLDASGAPVTKPRLDPDGDDDGDWILIDMAEPEPSAKQEPDQGPALESIN